MTRITETEITQILSEHKLWLVSSGKEGKRADLSGFGLRSKLLLQKRLFNMLIFCEKP